MRSRKLIAFHFIAAAILVLAFFSGQTSAQEVQDEDIKKLTGGFFAGQTLAEQEQVIELGPGSAHPGTTGEVRLHLVLLADEKDHGPEGNGLHDYPLWQKRWALLLGGEEASKEKQVNLVGPPDKDRDTGEGMPNVAVSTAWHWPFEEQFQTADVIVAYCYLEWTDERLAQVRRYLEGGGGLVLIHSATWTKPKPSREVAEVVGVGGFKLFRHGMVQMEVLASEHPICAGLPETITLENDETYWPPTPIMESVTVLATSVEDKAKKRSTPRAAQPMFWCYELGEGRVFGCVPGHRAKTFDDPVFRKLLFRGIAWTAREEALLFDEVFSKTGKLCSAIHGR